VEDLRHPTVAEILLEIQAANREQAYVLRGRAYAEGLVRMKRAGTRQILGWLSSARVYGECHGVSYEDLKIELATREHVPNKIEAKEQRRAVALRHRKNKLRGSVSAR
jgi:hypothetical protein